MDAYTIRTMGPEGRKGLWREWNEWGAREGQTSLEDDPDPTDGFSWHLSQALVLDHARGTYSRRRAPWARNDTLNDKDRRSLEIQTGVSFDTQSEAEAWAEVHDMRFTEKGDRQREAIRELNEWHSSGKNEEERGGAFQRKQTWNGG